MLHEEIEEYILNLLSKYKGMSMKKSDIIDMIMNTFSMCNKAPISIAICNLISQYKIELFEGKIKLTEAYNHTVSPLSN